MKGSYIREAGGGNDVRPTPTAGVLREASTSIPVFPHNYTPWISIEEKQFQRDRFGNILCADSKSGVKFSFLGFKNFKKLKERAGKALIFDVQK